MAENIFIALIALPVLTFPVAIWSFWNACYHPNSSYIIYVNKFQQNGNGNERGNNWKGEKKISTRQQNADCLIWKS